MKPITEEHLGLFRRHMAEVVDMHFELASEEIGKPAPGAALRRALLHVPRHLFVAPQLMGVAYQDMPLPIGFDKTVSQPFIGALMIDLLDVEPGTRVLEVGTGLGYQAALLSEMGARVWSIDVVEEFVEGARARLAALDYAVAVLVGDGSRGWAEHAPFDAILVTAAAPAPPPALLDQLKGGGRMAIPVGGKDGQQLSLIEKRLDGELLVRRIMPAHFTQLEIGA